MSYNYEYKKNYLNKLIFRFVLSQILGKLINYLYCTKKKNSTIFIPVDRDFFINTVKISVYSKIFINAKKFETKVFILKQWLTDWQWWSRQSLTAFHWHWIRVSLSDKALRKKW